MTGARNTPPAATAPGGAVDGAFAIVTPAGAVAVELGGLDDEEQHGDAARVRTGRGSLTVQP